jgi:hypothetical protein
MLPDREGLKSLPEASGPDAVRRVEGMFARRNEKLPVASGSDWPERVAHFICRLLRTAAAEPMLTSH